MNMLFGNLVSRTAHVASAGQLGLQLLATASALAAEPSPWTQIADAKPALAVDQTLFSDQRGRYLSYDHQNGSHSDWAIVGSMATAKPNIVIFVVRQTNPSPITFSLMRNLEEFGEIKLAPHRYRPAYYVMTTRFGDLRGIAFDVSADGIRKYCVGFHKPESNGIFLKGFVCSGNENDSTPQNVACIVDKTRYIRQEDEDLLKAGLVQGEAKPCGARLLDSKPDEASKAKPETL